MNLSFIELFIALGGSSGISILFMHQIQRRKEKALAGQEEGKEKAEHANAQKITDEVYALMSSRLKEQFIEQEEKIDKLEETQRQLLHTVKIQKGQIESLEQTVNEYKALCDSCEFRNERVTLRKTK